MEALMSGSLEGKVALITGAVRRNGRAMAHLLAEDGAAIVINARRSEEEAQQVRAEIERMGAQALVCIADVTDEAAVSRMYAAIDERFGRLDILVNNAADRARVPFTELTLAQWRQALAIIMDGAFLCSRSAIPRMLKNGWGRIVNISGISNHLANYSGRAHIAAAKAGLEGLTRALANEYARQNITVNCVAPGRIGGERSKTSGEVQPLEVPVGRDGNFNDIARVVRFLCQPDSSFITGQIHHVNGGQYLN
jgi:3-oxoacyl-[acyl-carrier protein] reductase